VNVNPLYSPRELRHQLRDADADTIIIFSGSTQTLAEVVEETPLRNVIVFGLDDLVGMGLPSPPADERLAGTVEFTDALNRGAELDLDEPSMEQDDLLFLQYTGGTTGLSKGAMLTHGNLLANIAQFEAVGAVPLKKPFSEVFTLLQTKAIDGQENTWSNIYSKKFFEVQDYITESNHGLIDYMIVTSSEFWMELPKDIRPIVKKSLEEAIAHGNKVANDKAISDRQKVADSGRSKILTLTPEQVGQWRKAMKPVWKKFEAEIGKDLIEAAAASNSSS